MMNNRFLMLVSGVLGVISMTTVLAHAAYAAPCVKFINQRTLYNSCGDCVNATVQFFKGGKDWTTRYRVSADGETRVSERFGSARVIGERSCPSAARAPKPLKRQRSWSGR